MNYIKLDEGMDGFLSGIGLMAIFAAIIFFLVQNDKKREDKIIKNEKLFSHIGGDDDLDRTMPRSKAIEKALSKPGVREFAEGREKECEGNRAMNDANDRKETIIMRTFSYQYENIVYEIFSPYAQKRDWPREKNKWFASCSLDKEFIVCEIMRLLHLSYNEAYNLASDFARNRLLCEYGDCVDWKKRCSIGTLLINDWDIISKFDNNLSKWMDSHPNVESRESAEQRRKEIMKKKEEEMNKYM